MKTLLAAVCCLTLAASAFLAVSYVTLKGTDDLRPIWSLFAFVVPSLLTLIVVAARSGATPLREAAPWLCWLIVATGGSLIWIGWSTISRTLSSSHFEGYALVMGAMAMLQGGLTVLVFATAGLQHRHSAGLP